jgi:RimJ/RimL family protein N-acetyltransferase
MHLTNYLPVWGNSIAAWVHSDQDLRWLAPSTLPPLTGEKINAWRKAGGTSLVGFEKHSKFPVAYGEINPMRSDGGRFWIGHVVVDSQMRGRGVGRRFVRGLLEEAFHEQHARRVSLVVFPENRAAVHCYRHCGFRIVGDEHHQFLPDGPRHRLLRLEAGPGALIPIKPQLRTPLSAGR